MAQRPSLTVVIPTYERPDWLFRAVKSLAVQRPVPGEVIAVVRDTDLPSHATVEQLQQSGLPFRLRKGVVTEPGFMPPVREGIRLADADVVAVMDDDAEALQGWVSGMIRHYEDETVGAVGGRYINVTKDGPLEVEEADRVGYVSVLGRFVGNMYKRPTFSEPRNVSFLMGGCMSYRRDVAKALEFDSALNHNVAYGYEVDLGLQVRAMKKRLIFDPAIAIHHYSAPRATAGMRDPDDGDAAFWSTYNEVRVAMRRLPAWHALLAVGWRLAVGGRRAPGIGAWIVSPVARRLGFRTHLTGANVAAIVRATKDLLAEAGSRESELGRNGGVDG
jgi:GT2 family glycosyltransferase